MKQHHHPLKVFYFLFLIALPCFTLSRQGLPACPLAWQRSQYPLFALHPPASYLLPPASVVLKGRVWISQGMGKYKTMWRWMNCFKNHIWWKRMLAHGWAGKNMDGWAGGQMYGVEGWVGGWRAAPVQACVDGRAQRCLGGKMCGWMWRVNDNTNG